MSCSPRDYWERDNALCYDDAMHFMDAKLHELGIDKNRFGRMISFVDYGNVNYWYERGTRDWTNQQLPPNSKLVIDVEKLGAFLDSFSLRKRFYYGLHPKQRRSWHILFKAESCGFVKVTKHLQFVRHYLDESEIASASDVSLLNRDEKEPYVRIPKSNFDVEISVDAIRLLEDYDTFVLLSGDADFANLAKYLKRMRKKVILIAAGEVFHTLREQSDLYVNAQRVKAQIASLKQDGRIKKNLAA